MMVHYSSISFDNLYFTHKLLDDKDYTLTLWRLTDLDEKTFKATNCDFKVWGKALTTYDALNMHMENINFDWDYSLWGFRCDVDCNFPGARTENEMVLLNITIFFGSGVQKSEMLNSFFSYSGPGNVTITDCRFLAESDLANNRSIMRMRLL